MERCIAEMHYPISMSMVCAGKPKGMCCVPASDHRRRIRGVIPTVDDTAADSSNFTTIRGVGQHGYAP